MDPIGAGVGAGPRPGDGQEASSTWPPVRGELAHQIDAFFFLGAWLAHFVLTFAVLDATLQ